MKGIVVTAENDVIVKDFGTPLYKTVGEAVGGHIEIVRSNRLHRPLVMVVNEEGLLRELPMNTLGCILYGTGFHGSPIVGDIVIMEEGFVNGEPDLVGIEESAIKSVVNQIQSILRLFKRFSK